MQIDLVALVNRDVIEALRLCGRCRTNQKSRVHYQLLSPFHVKRREEADQELAHSSNSKNSTRHPEQAGDMDLRALPLALNRHCSSITRPGILFGAAKVHVVWLGPAKKPNAQFKLLSLKKFALTSRKLLRRKFGSLSVRARSLRNICPRKSASYTRSQCPPGLLDQKIPHPLQEISWGDKRSLLGPQVPTANLWDVKDR